MSKKYLGMTRLPPYSVPRGSAAPTWGESENVTLRQNLFGLNEVSALIGKNDIPPQDAFPGRAEIPSLSEELMSDRLTPAQVRGARGMLNWSMINLAEAARVSVSTVKRFETAAEQPVSDDTVAMMRDALEAGGVNFLADEGNGPGLRCRPR